MADMTKDELEDLANEITNLTEVSKLSVHKQKKRINSIQKNNYQELFSELINDLNIPSSSIVHFNKKMIRSVKKQYISNKKSSENKPLSTIGCTFSAGRYHTINDPQTLYFSCDMATVTAELRIDEIEEPIDTFPTRIKLNRVLDLSTQIKCQSIGISQKLLEYEWKFFNDFIGIHAFSQLLGVELAKRKIEGVLFRSVRNNNGQNLAVFVENLTKGSFIYLKGGKTKLKKQGILIKNQFLGQDPRK